MREELNQVRNVPSQINTAPSANVPSVKESRMLTGQMEVTEKDLPLLSKLVHQYLPSEELEQGLLLKARVESALGIETNEPRK